MRIDRRFGYMWQPTGLRPVATNASLHAQGHEAHGKHVPPLMPLQGQRLDPKLLLPSPLIKSLDTTQTLRHPPSLGASLVLQLTPNSLRSTRQGVARGSAEAYWWTICSKTANCREARHPTVYNPRKQTDSRGPGALFVPSTARRRPSISSRGFGRQNCRDQANHRGHRKRDTKRYEFLAFGAIPSIT
jgi:hypothetical protein